MNRWDPQHFRREGQRRGIAPEILSAAEAIASNIHSVDQNYPPIFSLKHLAQLSNVKYGFLRKVVDRSISDPYEVFRIRKRNSGRFRIICVPQHQLLVTQKWITQNILRYVAPHTASYAFVPKMKAKHAATIHCGSNWLIKMDVRRFFESISEIAVYRVFVSLGYESLLSLELARICTRLGSNTRTRQKPRWYAKSRERIIQSYEHPQLGHLPQGAPTSPMLSNLAMIEFDKVIDQLARKNDLVYSRYADDLCFSKADKEFSRRNAAALIGRVSAEMGRWGLSPNFTKTKVSPPGSRKIVLGLLVDGADVRLSRRFRGKLRQHIFYLTHPKIGPARHAKERGFSSVEGMRNHIAGLVAYAHDIDPEFARKCQDKLNNVQWPFDNG